MDVEFDVITTLDNATQPAHFSDRQRYASGGLAGSRQKRKCNYDPNVIGAR